MSDAEFILGKDERTRGGSLPGPVLDKVTEILQRGGCILLPSDTCYSLAALPPGRPEVRRRINTVLGRDDIPISLAFPSILATHQWIAQDETVEGLLKGFCPGPLTVICSALREKKALPTPFFETGIKVMDRTIGVRIPDSIIERDVAACTEFPITTVAVRTTPGYKDPIQDFHTAYDTVRSGMNDIEPMRWAAIEGSDFYLHNSTIVRVPGTDGPVELIRPGDIAFADILAHLGLPG